MRAFYAGLLYLFLLLPSDLGAVDMVEIDIMAKVAAAEDADGSGVLWGFGNYFVTFVNPYLLGPVVTVVGYNIKGDATLSLERLMLMQHSEYSDGELLYFKTVYENERARLQKKENGRGALVGMVAGWATWVAIISAFINS